MEKINVINSLVYKFIERIGVQFILIVFQFALARILLPDDFGLVALTSIFMSISGIFIDSGIGSSLIQKKDADEKDFSSAFFLMLAVAIFLYAVIFIAAPFIAEFYHKPILVSVLRTVSIGLIIGAFNSIQNVQIAKKLLFKQQMKMSVVSLLLSSTIGIILAKAGFGVWALIGYRIINQITTSILLWLVVVRWQPQWYFSMRRIKPLFSYGWKLLAAAILEILNTELTSLVIGKTYNMATLAYFKNGGQIPNMLVGNINGAIGSVLFPVMANKQEDLASIRNLTKRGITVSSFLIFPMLVGLAVVAKPLIKLILTDKWLPMVPFMQVFCATYLFWPIHTVSLQVYTALGRSDIFLRLEIIKKAVGIAILIISIPYGAYAMAWGIFFTSIICVFINAYPNKLLISYSVFELIKDIMPNLLLAIFSGVLAHLLHFLSLNYVLVMLLQLVLITVVYFGIAFLLNIKSMSYLISTIRELNATMTVRKK